MTEKELHSYLKPGTCDFYFRDDLGRTYGVKTFSSGRAWLCYRTANGFATLRECSPQEIAEWKLSSVPDPLSVPSVLSVANSDSQKGSL